MSLPSASEEDPGQDVANSFRYWGELHDDIINQFFLKLDNFQAQICFRGVCRNWRKAGYSSGIEVPLLDDKHTYRLVRPNMKDSSRYEVDDGSERTPPTFHYSLNLSDLAGCKLVGGLNGWWILMEAIDRMALNFNVGLFLYNPCTRVRFDLPMLDPPILNFIPWSLGDFWVTFTAPYASPKCSIIFVVLEVTVDEDDHQKGELKFALWKKGMLKWKWSEKVLVVPPNMPLARGLNFTEKKEFRSAYIYFGTFMVFISEKDGKVVIEKIDSNADATYGGRASGSRYDPYRKYLDWFWTSSVRTSLTWDRYEEEKTSMLRT